MKANTPAQCREIANKCLEGSSTPNGIRDLPDIFWLMGWADWEIEAQILEDIHEKKFPVEPRVWLASE